MDPYEVLGVSRDADEETIKKAYRALVKKYHPDRYVNTPMADMASEKMKQINEAYDMITNKNTGSHNQYSGGYGGYGGGYYSGQTYTTPSFQNVRALIAMRQLAQAEAMLNQLPQTAEWYYLMGVICMNRGWYNRGMEYINKAIQLDPTNMEYQSTANTFKNNNQSYRNVVFTSNNNAMCGICPSLCASWLLCNCCNNPYFCCWC